MPRALEHLNWTMFICFQFSPFSKEVWVFLGLSYAAVSLCFFCLGRICRSQWENPYPCIEEPTCLENQFSMQNSMWFAIGALLQQGNCADYYY